MTDTSHRLYAIVIAVVVFFTSWAAVAAQPWATAKPDPRLVVLAHREQRLRADAKIVQQVVNGRMATYEQALRTRNAQIAAARAQIAAARARSLAGVAVERGGVAVTVRRGAERPRRQPSPTHDHADVVMLRRTFTAMGTEVELLLDAQGSERAHGALDRAEEEFERLEQTMSRFRPDSELSLLNRDGVVADATPDLVRVVELALDAREATGGLFDPTVHDAVVVAGYDRTFADVAPDAPAVRDQPPARCGGGVRVEGTTIVLDPGSRLDLGGIGKGYAVDRVADLLAEVGPCLVNAGGDLAVRGGSWPVGVTHDVTLELTRGGLATSGRDRRRWIRDGQERHHLIDPATGRPATNAPLRVTVVAGSAAAAEVAAKAAFLGADGRSPPRRRHPRRTDDPGGRPGMRHDPTFWLLARASGITAYLMLTLSVLAGLLVKSRPFRALKPAAVTDLHRMLAMLGLGAPAGHAAALVLDTTVKVSVPGLFVPGLVSYRPVWTSFGILAAELMVLVYASFSLRKRIGTKNWRRLHWATYAIFGAATVHGIAAGTDTSRPWAFALYVFAVGSVAAATTWRFLVPPTPARARRKVASAREITPRRGERTA